MRVLPRRQPTPTNRRVHVFLADSPENEVPFAIRTVALLRPLVHLLVGIYPQYPLRPSTLPSHPPTLCNRCNLWNLHALWPCKHQIYDRSTFYI